jgi:NAD+ kinase
MLLQSTTEKPLLKIQRIGVFTRDDDAISAGRALRERLKVHDVEVQLLEDLGEQTRLGDSRPDTPFSEMRTEVTEGISESPTKPYDFRDKHGLKGANASADTEVDTEAISTTEQDSFIAGDVWQPDLLLALGGDGTVLQALCNYPTIPVLPVNFGTIGFLTAGNQDDLDAMIDRVLSGDYYLEERTILTSTFNGTETEVINELVVKGTTKMVVVEIWVDGNLVHTIRGDGVIVGSPTGSTSYLMSTGASIVMPTVDAIIIGGINEHRFASRSLVLSGKSTVKLRVHESTRETDLFASHDGRDRTDLVPGDELTIRRSDNCARLIQFDPHTFFHNLKNRLDW